MRNFLFFSAISYNFLTIPEKDFLVGQRYGIYETEDFDKEGRDGNRKGDRCMSRDDRRIKKWRSAGTLGELYLKEMAEQFGIENDVRVSTLSRYPDVFVMEEQSPDEQKLWAGLEQALRQAAVQFVESRIKEGERLRADLVEKLDGMISYVDYIEERSPQVLEEYRMRLESKVQELLGDRQLDDARIAAEITIFADKICVDEETVRLRSHILSMKETLLAGGGMGRKLDFIAQEMNREANTILSKTTDLKVSDVGINLKTDIEKVREQIQNIE